MMRRWGPLLMLAALAGGCSGDDGRGAADDAPAHEWSYEDVASWGGTCASGEEQSPVDLAGATSEDLADIEFDYRAAEATVVDNGHTVQVTFEDAGSIQLDGETYQLRQFHFHAPSEHSVDGTSYAAEVHLVHEAADGRLAVVGVLVEVGAADPLIESVLEVAPEEGEAPAATDGPVDPAALLPADRRAFRYDGSLTTPPCTEGVTWSVLPEPVTWSEEQVAAFATRHPESHRPTQPLDGRVLILDAR